MSNNIQTQLANAKITLQECKRELEQLIAGVKQGQSKRLIVKLNPPQRWWSRKEPTSHPQVVSNSELKQMRRVHRPISDRWYTKLKKESLEKQIPVSREFLRHEIQRRAATSTTLVAGAGATGV